MEFKPTGINRAGGFTLVEMLVAVPLCMLLMAVMVSLYCYTTTSFASLTSYAGLDQKTRYASDVISRDVRCATSVDDTTVSNKLVLNTISGPVTYLYNNGAGTLVRSNGTEVTQILTNLVSLSFSLYQRPTNSAMTYETLAAASPGSTKLVGFSWKCSQRVVGSRFDSQDLTTGIVELRNQ
ncbi:MAG TPA: hypothetical protein VLT36_18025 [Candidatus Dormibacteraeota bacterium]|nr:hypothetical protein [Candidatus Dormibacteraeota bacterium]